MNTQEMLEHLRRNRVAHSNRIHLIRTKSRPDAEFAMKNPSTPWATARITALHDDLSIARWHRRDAQSFIAGLRVARSMSA